MNNVKWYKHTDLNHPSHTTQRSDFPLWRRECFLWFMWPIETETQRLMQWNTIRVKSSPAPQNNQHPYPAVSSFLRNGENSPNTSQTLFSNQRVYIGVLWDVGAVGKTRSLEHEHVGFNRTTSSNNNNNNNENISHPSPKPQGLMGLSEVTKWFSTRSFCLSALIDAAEPVGSSQHI